MRQRLVYVVRHRRREDTTWEETIYHNPTTAREYADYWRFQGHVVRVETR